MTDDSEVIIVGAGLAGLCCALRLKQDGVEPLILEAADGVGGRVRTDQIGGFRLDRGFQVFLSAYPEARRVLDYDALDLRPFYAGALVRTAGAFHRVVDPWRHPWDGLRHAFSPIGSPLDKLRVGRLRRHVMRADLNELFALPDTSSLEFLRLFRFSQKMIDRFFRPFFGGVFLESDLETSSRMLQFVFRMFASGDATLPAGGMGEISAQLAGRLPSDRIRYRSEVVKVDGTTVKLASGEQIQAGAVVVATEGQAAALLDDGVKRAGARSVACLYFAAEKAPVDEPILVLDAERQGPVNNLCIPSNTAPGYAPPGGSLISATVLGTPSAGDSILESDVRSQLRSWFGSVVDSWEYLRTYRIANALPVVEPRWSPGADRPIQLGAGRYICGDYMVNPSIQGAMLSGRLTAECVLADME